MAKKKRKKRTRVERIAKRVTDQLEKLGWSQADLVHATGLTRNAVSRIVRGTNEAGYSKLEAVAEALGLPVAEMIQ